VEKWIIDLILALSTLFLCCDAAYTRRAHRRRRRHVRVYTERKEPQEWLKSSVP
jgi:hypothetical protein